MKKYIVQIVFLDRQAIVKIFKAKDSFDLEDKLKLEVRHMRDVVGVEYTTIMDFLEYGSLAGTWVGYKSLIKGVNNQETILGILKKRAKKIAEFPGQEKEPDIQITAMPEADEEYETIINWLEEEE